MSSSFFGMLGISKQDMMSRLNDLDIVSNNLSNLYTSGFKQSRLNFQELYQDLKKEGAYTPTTQTLTSQGAIRTTTRDLDVAINGDGYFEVTLPDGTAAYTRDGEFQLDSENKLVTSSGYPVVWDGEIPTGTDGIDFQKNGVVFVRQGTNAWQEAGTIEINRFQNATALQSHGNNLYLVTVNSGEAQAGAPGSEGYGQLLSHSIEQSNVSLSEQMSHLISLERGFQISTRVFQQSDQMMAQALQMRKG
jgi:flagellar basal-body rod protein FlgG